MSTETSHDRKLEYLPVDELVKATRNPKSHDTKGLARSISRWGFADAPILDERTGHLVAGHGRLEDLLARQAAGEEPPAGIHVDPDSLEWLAPVQRGWSSSSDEEAEAFLIAHNRLTETGAWDNLELAEMLAGLAETDHALLLASGYTDTDLDVFRRLAEAESTFTVDQAGAVDEFLKISGTGGGAITNRSFSAVRVYFEVEADVKSFYEKLGLPYTPDKLELRWGEWKPRHITDFNA